MASLVDANLILRFLTEDATEQTNIVKKLFAQSKDLILTDLTIAEVIWVLKSVYKLPKQDITEKFLYLLNLDIFTANYPLLNRALELFNNYNISFADAYLVAYAEEENLEGIYSFDKGLDKVGTIKRLEP